MFRVPTYLAPSPIEGIGVFTPLPIAAGTLLWEITTGVDWEMTPAELDGFPEPYQTSLRRWCYENERGLFVLCGDNARFMNHSFAPNCDDSGELTVAVRDIAPGEELTCDYRSFDRPARTTGRVEFIEPILPGRTLNASPGADT
ncbi:MAG TPA: SET domain-containing protein [Longimicrobiales bacterium]|jgi:hypothetical protein